MLGIDVNVLDSAVTKKMEAGDYNLYWNCPNSDVPLEIILLYIYIFFHDFHVETLVVALYYSHLKSWTRESSKAQ